MYCHGENLMYSSACVVVKRSDGSHCCVIDKETVLMAITKPRKYSFVHIDVDLYQPTLDSHEYFFERLHKGGIIVCDDYGYSQFPGASLAVDKFISSLSRDSYSHFFKHSFGTSVIIK